MALEYFYKICLNLEKPSSIVFKVYRYKKCTCKMEGNVSLFWIEKFITIFHYQKFFSILFFFFSIAFTRMKFSYVLTSDLFARLNFTLNFNVN